MSQPQSPDPGAKPPGLALMEMLAGKWIAQAISTAARLKVADALAGGPRTPEELAATCGADPQSLHRLLRATASVGVFAEDGAGRFGLTPLADCLRSDVPGSLRAMAAYIGAEWDWRPWGDLIGSVRTGQVAFEKSFGKGVFDYLADHPEEAADFHGGMAGWSKQTAAAVVAAYDFSGFGTIVDVGGGTGSLLAGILAATPSARGVVFDSPHVVSQAGATLASAGVADRARTEGGDFFRAVPDGGDAYLMRHIIHDWDDERAATILRNCRKAIRPEGKVLLMEVVIPPGNGPSFGKLLDLEMLVIAGGRERTEEEYGALFAAAGFRLARVIPTPSPLSIIEAVPAE